MTVALVVAGASFLEQLDGTIVVAVLPQIGAEFGTGGAQMTTIATAYLVAVATFIPLGAWLAGKFGARTVFCAALVLFALASIGCAASPTAIILVAARFVQGAGGAMALPVGRLLVLQSAGRERLLRLTAVITWPGLVAPVAAPLLGATITALWGWRWIFLVSATGALLVLGCALVFVRDGAVGRVSSRPDWRGLGGLTLSLFGGVGALEILGGRDEGMLVPGFFALAIAVVISIWTVRHLRRSPEPLLDLRVLRNATFREANLYGSAFRAAVASAPFTLPLLLLILGFSPVQSALFVSALFAGNIGIKPFTSALLRRRSFRFVTVLAAVGSAACFCVFALLPVYGAVGVIVAVMLVSGIFRSLGFTAFNTVQFADVKDEELASANALAATFQQASTAAGIALSGVLLTLLGALGGFAFASVYLFMALVCLAAAAGMARFPQTAGDHVRSARN